MDFTNADPIDIDHHDVTAPVVRITHWFNDGHLASHTPEFFASQISGVVGDVGQVTGAIPASLRFEF